MVKKIKLLLVFTVFFVFTGVVAFGSQPISIFVNGEKIVGDTPAIIINGRTMVPIRLVAEALNAKVSWNANTNSVIIKAAPEPEVYNLIKLNGEPTTWPYWYENKVLYMEYRNVVELLRVKYPATWNNVSFSTVSKQIVIRDRFYDVNTDKKGDFTVISLNSLKNREAIDFDWDPKTGNIVLK